MNVYILAGGKSSRMGEDKALRLFHGKPLLQYALETARQIGDRIFILSHHPEHQVFGCPLLADHFPDSGAAGGIDSMLHHEMPGEKFLLSCDMPMVDVPAINQLRDHHRNGSITIYKTATFPEPLVGIYSSDQAISWRKGLENQVYKLSHLLEKCNTQYIDAEQVMKINPLFFMNVNDKNDILALEKQTMTIQCYGRIKEITGADIIVVQMAENEKDLREKIIRRFPILQNEAFAVAVNRKILSSNETFLPDSEIALLPPFSGG